MLRKVIVIHEELCNGCGICVDACHEGAIELVDGKAKLVSDAYCDGLGACLPECPTGAIELIEREAAPFDEALVEERLKARGVPGRLQEPEEAKEAPASELRQWPIQISLVHPRADFFQDADLLIAADCTAFAHGYFHREFMHGRVTLIGCPKLDDTSFYTEKLTAIFTANRIRSITVVRMLVPCCGGIVNTVERAMLQARIIVPYQVVTLGLQGETIA